ncbi:ATP-binding cassette domain-containing protein [Colidextribacter sp. OB.20]|uniref:AAA family ATPase n=1 Tax=Colidextribacter sp. OB.20 TaxID=2304568 RepID=UPI00136CBB3C|nr:ATP-binding protein [Colidextribacter sp. OB.20]NBI08913.1 ATP-binding cassette domain-containing protein [Colidextribacter sp. OB.20]
MKLKKISFGNFKSLYDVSFEPGRVNVFVGANGAGKSTLLEAIGLLSAAMTDRVDSTALQRRGVRLSVPSLYKSNFKNISRQKPTIYLSLGWESEVIQDLFRYDVHLTSPTDSELWKYHSEAFFHNGEKKWGRSNASSKSRNSAIGGFLVDNDEKLSLGREMAVALSAYGIFQPNTMTLRGTVADPNQMTPIGLNGGRLAEAISDLIRTEDEDIFFGDMYIEDVLDLIDWASEITVNAPKKSSINANIPTTRQIIEFTDRYMRNSAKFTAYDASEGALYVLFMLALAMHPQGPNIFAIDSFDHALNPRLARKLTATFCEQIIQKQKCVFLTTHNPFVLDGLDLNNDDIRLFAIDRNLDGYAQITRIKISQELIKEDQPLSRLWINGRLGGVPPLL